MDTIGKHFDKLRRMPRTHAAVDDAAQWIMRTVLLFRAWGLGASFLWHPLERESAIYGVLYFDWHLDESKALWLENASLWIYVAFAVCLFAERFGSFAVGRKLATVEKVMLAYLVLWELWFTIATMCRGGEFMCHLAWASNALRIGTPLFLLMVAGGVRREWSIAVLRLAVSLTFAAHGVKAWQQSPTFITIMIGVAQNVLGFDVPQSEVAYVMRSIGAVDFLLAAVLLTRHPPTIVLYMACWGLVTACGRTVGTAWSNYPETLLRLVHAGGPLVLYLVEMRRELEQLSGQPMSAEDQDQDHDHDRDSIA